MPPEIRKLKQLEDENARLKKIVADLTLDREMLQDVIRRSFKACSEAGGGEGYVPGLDDLDPACSRRFGRQRRQEIANGVRLPVKQLAKASGVSIGHRALTSIRIWSRIVLTRGDSRSAVMVLQQTLNCWQRCWMNSFCWSRADAFSRTGLIGAACLMSTGS